jgi:integrase/recombinase XerD
MTDVRWDRYPTVEADGHARGWLGIQADLGRAANTVEAYGRGLEDFLRFSQQVGIQAEVASRADVAAYVRRLADRPSQRAPRIRRIESHHGLSNATIQQRLTIVRLFYDYLVEEGVRTNNPVGRGKYTPGTAFGGARERGLLPRYRKLPWIPSDDQWEAVVRAAHDEPLRNQLMLKLAYDGALRREELCTLESGDLDPARREIRIRAEVTKGRTERRARYTEQTGQLLCPVSPSPAVPRSRVRSGIPLRVAQESRPADLDLDMVQGRRRHRQPYWPPAVHDPHAAPPSSD